MVEAQVTNKWLVQDVLKFLKGTVRIPQTQVLCPEHDEDVAIVVKTTPLDPDATYLHLTGCCEAAIRHRLELIEKAAAWRRQSSWQEANRSRRPNAAP